jgi:hypothetical protein
LLQAVVQLCLRQNWPSSLTDFRLSCFIAMSLFLCAGWFASGALLGGFGKDAQGGNTAAATVAAAKTWALGVPLGIAIRSISR